MAEDYQKVIFKNGEAPAVNATNLNHMQAQYEKAKELVVAHEAEKATEEQYGHTKLGSIGIAPNNVSNLNAVYTSNALVAALYWTDPEDTIIGDNIGVKWAGTKIVRKEGSYPSSIQDGTLVYDSKTRNAHSTIATAYIDLTALGGKTYYYRLFPYSVDGAHNPNNVSANRISIEVIQPQMPLEIKSSGVFVVPAGVTSIDLFLVGGGGGSGYTDNGKASGGGGGGRTKTYKDSESGYKDGGAIAVTPGEAWNVVIGSGGSAGTNASKNGGTGGTTRFYKGDTEYNAAGGSGSLYASSASSVGANGGSGGGGGGTTTSGQAGGAGGSNGNSGSTSATDVSGGTGQGHTTRAFGDAAGTLYAGGGGGGGTLSGGIPGGDGGGGTGGSRTVGTGGSANTGGGAGGSCAGTDTPRNGAPGGSGIAIVRWEV